VFVDASTNELFNLGHVSCTATHSNTHTTSHVPQPIPIPIPTPTPMSSINSTTLIAQFAAAEKRILNIVASANPVEGAEQYATELVCAVPFLFLTLLLTFLRPNSVTTGQSSPGSPGTSSKARRAICGRISNFSTAIP
jgi:hypothetical protein